ncbi:MAG: spore maturation protein [Oscillospiraceae bacterium]|jgi:spore maturation protein B|nr:spore maturation protein [Oscillospiraceae bacterium]
MNIGSWAVPSVIFLILSFSLLKKTDIFESFVGGAEKGIATTVSIIPSLVALITAVTMLKASGALEILTNFISPLTNFLKFPAELVPLAVLKPISGSASIAVFDNILKSHGPDSEIGRIASVIVGSTETTLYTIAIYFGSVGIKNIRHTATVALVADAFALVASVVTVRIIFGCP